MCPSCGQPVAAGQRFCASCGAPLSQPSPAYAGIGAGTPLSERPDIDYSSESKLAAGILTLFFPFISLIVALVMRSSERLSLRRASLRTWAIASAAWLGVGIVIVIIVVAAAGSAVSHNQPSTKGPCQGGPNMGASGTPIGNGKYRFPCAFGGSTVVNLGS
jgi:zinc ribbon protein